MKKVLCLLLAALMALALFSCAAAPAADNQAPSAAPPSDSQSETPPAAPPSGEAQTPPDNSSNNQSNPDNDLDYILNKGTLVIGITEYAPMNFYDDNGTLVGFDTEFAEALCANLGVTPEFIVIDWGTKEIELAAKNIDCIWNGLTVTEERRENMAFTNSYLRNEQVVVIRAEDADKYTDIASLAGAAIVAEDGSAGASAVEMDIPGANLTPVAAQSTALLEVKAGTADVAVIDLTMAREMTGDSSDYSDLMLVTSIKMTPEEYAIGLRLGSTAVGVFNELIDELNALGTLSEFADKYGVADLLVK